MIGTTIGQYRILEKLGSGGMGVVYKATDARLGRSVAIKFLHESVENESEALKRFRREAQALSALNHPNICTIHDIGEYEGRLFIVMEAIEGETLDRWLEAKGLGLTDLLAAGAPIPDIAAGGVFGGGPTPSGAPAFEFEDVFAISIQIADALDAAHSRGLIHRDVKPANILVSGRLHTKLLDFGLAKLVGPSGPDRGLTADQSALTGEGNHVGTVAYMSPEQIEAGEVDRRTDIFSFGAVLYEMVTGRHPFLGRTAVATLAAILKDDPPPIDDSRQSVPEPLKQIIRRCLSKAPSDRFSSARDLAEELERARRSALAPTAASGPSRQPNVPQLAGKIRLGRGGARGLFIFIQLGYLGIYVAALGYLDDAVGVIERDFMTPAGFGLPVLVALAMIGIVVRLFLTSAVALDHTDIGAQFGRLFPFLLVLDVAWAMSPLLLAERIGTGIALAGLAGLAYAPFSQRTLMRAAYH